MSPRRIRLAMLSVFAIVFLFSALFLFRDYTKVRTLTGTSDIWSVVRFAPGGLAVLQSVEPSDFAGPFLPQDGDTLLTIGGQRATADTYFAFFNNRTAPGAVFPATFRHGDRILETTLIARLVPAGLRLQVVTLYLLRILLIVGLLGVGVWACVHRGTSAAVRSLALYCATTAVLLQVYQPILPAAYASFRLPWQPVLVALFGSFALLSPAFWLKLQLLFPTTNRLYERHRWIANAVLFLPAASIALLALLRRPEAGTARLLYDLGFLSAGFILLLIHYRRAASPLLRRQTRLVLWGSGPATVLSVSFAALWLLSPEALSGLSTVAGLYPVTLQFLLILVIPISFAIAFGRYGLLEVEGKVKRGTRFALSNALLLVLFVGVLYGFAKFLLASLRIDTQAPTLVLGIVLALAFAPSRRRLHEALESRIYPERRRLRRLVRGFLRSAERTTDARAFWRELSRKLAARLGTAAVYPVLRNPAVAPRGNGHPAPPPTLFAEIEAGLRAAESPLVVDELFESGRLQLPEASAAWLAAQEITAILPLRTSSGTTGYLLLSRKQDGEDYTADELALLRPLARQIALAGENLQLLEDRLAKEKLEEQLGIARGIQEGLMPGDLPRVEGLEIASRIRFCLDVAGDYYDVMPLPDGRTLFAIADVVGKGVGAALLMANLQASLRVLRTVDLPLSDLVSKVNDLIYANTPSDMFITLFVAVYDPGARRLTYVNAGHNPPFLIRSDGCRHRLETGGLVLGICDGPEACKYEEASIDLDDEDLLLLYTDGVSEAMDRHQQEFGEERMVETFLQSQRRRLSGGPFDPPLSSGGDSSGDGGGRCEEPRLADSLARLEEEVVRFTGTDRLQDDATLLAVRVARAGEPRGAESGAVEGELRAAEVRAAERIPSGPSAAPPARNVPVPLMAFGRLLDPRTASGLHGGRPPVAGN